MLQNILDDILKTSTSMQIPERIVPPYPWCGHFAFTHYLLSKHKPKVIVELGTHSGNSYNYICQLVKQFKLDTACYAVDCWEGDVQAGFYQSSVYEELSVFQQARYSDFSVLKKMYFDQAVDDFDDGSIDLLHIDGLHTYEAVKNDFLTWRNKLSPRAVVLFHDTAVIERGFGVHKFWSELMEEYKGFNFSFSHGLGVLLVGTDVCSELYSLAELGIDPSFKKIDDTFYFLNKSILTDDQFYYVNEVYQKSLSTKVKKYFLSEIYYSDDGSFSSENYSHKLNVIDVGENILEYFFEKKASKIRFDLCYESVIMHKNIIIECKVGDIYKRINFSDHNGISIGDKIYFPQDPQIYISLPEKCDSIRININLIKIDYSPDAEFFYYIRGVAESERKKSSELETYKDQLLQVDNIIKEIDRSKNSIKWTFSNFLRNVNRRLLGK